MATNAFLQTEEDFATSVWPRSAAMWATCAYMALYIVRPWETLIPELAPLRFERIAYIAILLVVMSSTSITWRFDRPITALLAFTGALCISTITAYDPGLAWSAADGFYVYLTKLLAVVLILSVVRTPYDLMYLIAVAVAVMATFAGKSLWEYTIHGAGRWSMGVTRLTGINDTFGHPNAVSALLVTTLPWWLFLRRSRAQFTAFWPARMVRWFNWFLWISVGIFVACLLLSGSRAGFVGLVAFGLLSWAGSAGNRLKMALVIVLAGLVVSSYLDEEHKQRIRSLWDDSAAVAGGQESKEGRMFAFQAGLRMFQQYPITGVGMGNFGHYRRRFDDGSNLEAHSIPAQLLGETGILGTLAFTYFVWTLFRATRTLNRAPEADDDDTARMLSCLGTAMRQSIFLLLLLGLANHSAYLFMWIWIAAFCSCGLLFSHDRSYQDNSVVM